MENTEKVWYKKWWGIFIIIILTLLLSLLVASAFYVIGQTKNIINENLLLANQIKKQAQYGSVGKDGVHWLGASNPKVTIVEFVDYACPHCASFFPKIREASVKYKDDLRVVLRDFPYLTDYSGDLSMAAYCAGEQGLFLQMHDKLFQNQGISSREEITALAYQVGADINRFKNCLENGKYLPQIQKDLLDAQRLGVSGTPTWFIDGYKIEGDIPTDVLFQIIESFINQK